MTKTAIRAVGIVGLLAIVSAATIYVTARPYQQDRILIALGLKTG